MTMQATPTTHVPGYHQPVAWVPLLRQPNLPHQFDLRFVLMKTRIRVHCNCGWTSRAVRPEDEGAHGDLRALYQAHLAAERALWE